MKKIIIPALSVLILAGCVSMTPPEAHCRHYVYSVDESHDANLVVDKAGTVKSILPTFNEIYARGKEDKDSGLNRQNALANAQAIRQEFLNLSTSKMTFNQNTSRTYEDYLSPKQAKGLGDALAQTYLDGFDGK